MDKKLILSRCSISSVGSAISGVFTKKKEERTAEEKSYDKVIAGCVRKDKHIQKPLSTDLILSMVTRLYSVTTIASSKRYGGTRTPVICNSFETACEIVENNSGDIWECSYMLVVIEAVVPNYLYNHGMDESYWYLWNLDKGVYEPIETPKEYVGVVGWGIG